MKQLKVELLKDPVLYETLFEVRFVTSQIGQAVIVLIYRRPLTEQWSAAALELSARLNGAKIVGRSRKVKLAPAGETIEEVLTADGRPLRYFQMEGAFSQPNAKVCEKMLEWALDCTKGPEHKQQDLLELYCGGGTFTAAMSFNFRKVLATEISKASVDLAHQCFAANGIENIKIARLSSEEFTEAFNGTKEFQRLKEAGISFSSYDLQTVLVDPPRAGLDLATCQLLCRFNKIVYISCNPETLARDIGIMQGTHEIVRLAAFDQFPYTHHLESGALLVRRSQSSVALAAPLNAVPVTPSEMDVSALGKRKSDTATSAEAVDSEPEKSKLKE
jgi:tRNA (uracil-5-)-methyltransferase